MTQPPRNGSGAPSDTDFESAMRARDASNAARSGTAQDQSAWGATSTMDGTPYGQQTQSGQGGRDQLGQAGQARHDDVTTANVPLVSGTRAPVDPRTNGTSRAAAPAASDPKAAGGHSARAARARGPRRARLQLRHIDPWTVLKFSCVLSIALFFVWLIVVGVLFGVLDGAGVIDKINSTVTTINGSGSNPPVTAGIVFGSAAIIGVVNIVLFIALSTVGSVVYNLCADLVGGIEVTLSER